MTRLLHNKPFGSSTKGSDFKRTDQKDNDGEDSDGDEERVLVPITAAPEFPIRRIHLL